MKKVVDEVLSVYSEFSQDGKGLNLDGLELAMKKLHGNMTRSEIRDVFNLVDLDDSKRIEAKEFLVALTIGMVLDAIPALSHDSTRVADQIPEPVSKFHGHMEEVKEMLTLIVTAYLIFDPNGNGAINKRTVEEIIEESGHKLGSGYGLSHERWNEMVCVSFLSCSPCLSFYNFLC